MKISFNSALLPFTTTKNMISTTSTHPGSSAFLLNALRFLFARMTPVILSEIGTIVGDEIFLMKIKL